MQELPWVVDTTGGNTKVRVDAWRPDETDWARRKLYEVFTIGEPAGQAFLMRLPTVRLCPGLGEELKLMEQLTFEGPDGELTTTDLRGPEEKSGPGLLVVCWNDVSMGKACGDGGLTHTTGARVSRCVRYRER